MPYSGTVSGPTTYGRPDRPPSPGVYGSPRQAPPAPPSRGSGRRARKRRDPLWAKLLVIFGALLMMASGGSIVGTKALVARYTSTINRVDGLPDHQGKVAFDGPINILLVGIDTRNNPGELIRSDTIMIVHIPASHDQAYLVSIPRDTDVQIPAFPTTGYQGGREKINAAFAFGSQGKGGWGGGLKLLAETIKQMSGISFDAAAIIDFDGFRKVVEALGGVHMCIDEETTSLHIGIDRNGKYAPPYRTSDGLHFTRVPGVKPMVYKPGCRDLAPWEALDYVRQREFIPDGDYGRQRHQQQFIKAIAKKAMSAGVLSNPAKLDRVIKAAGSALTVDFGGADVLDWMFTLKNVGDNSMVMIKTNGGHYQSVKVNGQDRETLSPESQQLFQAVRDDKVPDFIIQHPDWVSKDS
ncbi:MAG TPA: LCP family protein [Micromonosporaceae bacterium]